MPAQFETVARVCAGEASFAGADNITKLTGTPSWSSAGTAAAWLALFGVPTEGQAGGNLRYITDVDIWFSATGARCTPSGATDADVASWVPALDETWKHMGDTIRAAKFFLPTGVTMYVRAWWGSL